MRAALLSALSFTSAASASIGARAAVDTTITQNQAAEFVILVKHGNDVFRTTTFYPDFDDPAARPAERDLKVFSGWKDDFYFVRQRGPRPSAWRNTVDHVFAMQSGRLIYLGAIDAKDCATLACGYEKGEFRDIYDGLEVNPATGNVDTPPLPIVRKVIDGKLVTDIERTWQINSQSYKLATACVRQAGQSGLDAPCMEQRSPWSSLVFAAKLTHYTGRQYEREDLFQTLAPSYCAKTTDKRCTFRVAGVKDHYARFDKGAEPVTVPYPLRKMDAVVAPEESRVTTFGPGKVIKLQ
jgi:hypothetical protein